jgi:hypothetical protein
VRIVLKKRDRMYYLICMLGECYWYVKKVWWWGCVVSDARMVVFDRRLDFGG